MDFSTSHVLATGADRRPGRGAHRPVPQLRHGVQAGARTPADSTKEGRRGGCGCVDL